MNPETPPAQDMRNAGSWPAHRNLAGSAPPATLLVDNWWKSRAKGVPGPPPCPGKCPEPHERNANLWPAMDTIWPRPFVSV
jgi:hypothetical protein